jgi:protein DGCR14
VLFHLHAESEVRHHHPYIGRVKIAQMSSAGSTDQALAKRSAETALMPPPPAMKRIKRPSKVLDEDTYTEAISHIIARDFFPGLLESKTQSEYLDALDSNDEEWIANAGRRLTDVMTPRHPSRRSVRRGVSMTPGATPFLSRGGLGGETPRGYRGETPMSDAGSVVSTTSTNATVKPEADLSLSLDAFQAKYTSEDNESFNTLLDAQNVKRAERYAWALQNGASGNNIPSGRLLAEKKREQALLESGEKDRPKLIEGGDKPAMPDSWPSRPKNNVMFQPDNLDETHPTLPSIAQTAQEQSRAAPKSVVYANTRLPPSQETAQQVPSSPSMSAIQDAIAGKPRANTDSEAGFTGAETPRINGYSFVDDAPSPAPSTSSSVWDSLNYDDERTRALLPKGDAKPSTFKFGDTTRREELHHRMVDKINKKRKDPNGKAEKDGSPVPRFASSPMIGRRGQALTPAGERLLRKVGSPRVGGNSPLGDKAKDSGFEGVFDRKTTQKGAASGLRFRWTPTPKVTRRDDN